MSFTSVKKWVFRGLLLVVLLAVCGIGWLEYEMRRGAGTFTEQVDADQFQRIDGPFAITNAQILSPDGNTMLAGQTVIIDAGLIQAVGPDIAIPPACQIIDASDQFLIPGLVDSHVHFEHTPNDALLYLANGVTQVRDMAGSSFHMELAKATADGQLGPDMFVACQKVYNKGGFAGILSNWTHNRINISSEEQAKQLVKRLANDGFDAVKISHGLRSEIYWALENEAKQQGIPLVGHIPNSISFEAFWNSNQTELAHVEELTKALDREFGGYNVDSADAFIAYVQKRGPEIAEKLVEHQIGVTTTVWLMESLPKQKLEMNTFIRQVALPYANPALVEGTRLRTGWLPGNNSYEVNGNLENPKLRQWVETYWHTHTKAIRTMTQILNAHGVHLMAGTDANTPLVVPGFSLLDEMILLSDYGLSNAQSLRSATLAPAEWTGEKAGKIAAGYKANLVLLNENPLADMAHIKSIESVLLKGQLLTRDQLDAMLAAVKAANDRSRSQSLDPYL